MGQEGTGRSREPLRRREHQERLLFSFSGSHPSLVALLASGRGGGQCPRPWGPYSADTIDWEGRGGGGRHEFPGPGQFFLQVGPEEKCSGVSTWDVYRHHAGAPGASSHTGLLGHVIDFRDAAKKPRLSAPAYRWQGCRTGWVAGGGPGGGRAGGGRAREEATPEPWS